MSKKKKAPGHYCKICGRRRANEKFSGKGHASHICKDCQKLSAEKRNELQTINRIMNLPFWLSKDQISFLKKMMESKNEEVAAIAQEAFNIRFPPKDPKMAYEEVPFISDELEEFISALTAIAKDGEMEDVNALLLSAAEELKNALGYLAKAVDELFDEEDTIQLTPEEEEYFVDNIAELPFP